MSGHPKPRTTTHARTTRTTTHARTTTHPRTTRTTTHARITRTTTHALTTTHPLTSRRLLPPRRFTPLDGLRCEDRGGAAPTPPAERSEMQRVLVAVVGGG